MQLAYGGKRFTAGSALISLREEYVRNTADQILETKRSAHIQGDLLTTSQNPTVAAAQADLKSQMDSLLASLLVQQQDLILYQDSGAEALSLKNSKSISGVKISNVSVIENRDPAAEFGSIITFSFDVESVESAPGSASLLIEYHESSQFGGGSKVIVCRRGINGVNQEQEIYPEDIYTCTVQGSAKGYKSYPRRPKQPGPEWKPMYGYSEPERHGRGYTAYPITWSFSRESIKPIEFIPRTWIGA